MKFTYLSLIFHLLCINLSYSKHVEVNFTNSNKLLPIGNKLAFIKINNGEVPTISALLNASDYEKNPVPNFDITSEEVWGVLRLRNKTKENSLILSVDYSIMDLIEVYEVRDNKLHLIEVTGDNFDYNSRSIKTSNFTFNLQIKSNEFKIFAIKVNTKEQLLMPVFITTNMKMAESEWSKNLIVGLCFGVLAVMFFYNLFLYIFIKDQSYLYYILYIFFIGFAQACLLGYPFKYLWPGYPDFNNRMIIVFGALAGISAVLFLRDFIQSKKYLPKLDLAILSSILVYVGALIAGACNKRELGYRLVDIAAIASSILALIISCILSYKGIRTARFYLIAWSVFLIGICFFVLRNFGIIGFSNFSNFTMLFGAALEATFLSVALADRINILKKEKVISQQEAINALEENKRLITQQNTELETKVKLRTHELESAYKNLQSTQSQLVNSEKMASLGQLTAGIAHEINNPINFVVSNITPLRRDINDILELVEKYEKISIANGLEDMLAEITQFRKEIDVDFVKEEIDMLLKGISEGASRTSEIIKSLRNFSRVDESDLKTANVNEGILSTLVLLSQQFDKITVIRNLGDVPKIECYPGKLNQAFMNIITNAIQAVSLSEKARIEITTQVSDENVIIKIKDNGSGMSEEIKSKIFDPFFTTKDVGKGTGLGLSITYGIIEKHKGKIEVISAIGEGTEFVITLPLKMPE